MSTKIVHAAGVNNSAVRLLPMIRLWTQGLVWLVVLAAVVSVPTSALAQCPSVFLPGGSVAGVNGRVYALERLPNGDIIVGGEFTAAGAIRANNLALYRFSSNEWIALGTGVNGAVRAIGAINGEEVLVAGDFTTANGLTSPNMVRVNVNTKVFQPVTPAPSRVKAIKRHPNGQMVVAGAFGGAGTQTLRSVAFWNPTTGVWTQMGSGILSSTSGVGGSPAEVNAIAIDNVDGTVYAVGDFTFPSNGSVKYTVSTNQWTGFGPSTLQTLYAVAVMPNRDVIIGGKFFQPNSSIDATIARYNRLGAFQSNLGLVRGQSSAGTVYSITVVDSSTVLVGGDFFSVDDAQLNNIRLNGVGLCSTGGTWNAMATGVTRDNGQIVHATLLGPNGDLYVGGNFLHSESASIRGIARYRRSTTLWSSLGSGTNAAINAMVRLPNGDIIAGGDFSSIEGVAAFRLARLSASTNQWSPIAGSPDGPVTALEYCSDGTLVVGGKFSNVGGVSSNRVARLNLTTGAWTSVGGSMSGSVYALAELPDGDILIGGQYITTPTGSSMTLARFDRETSTFVPIPQIPNDAISPSVRAMAKNASGEIYMVGSFARVGMNNAGNVACFQPATNTWRTNVWGFGSPGQAECFAVAIDPNGIVIVGGRGANPGPLIGRYNPATNSWLPMNLQPIYSSSYPYINTVAVLPNGRVCIGGLVIPANFLEFTKHFAEYDPVTDTWAPFNINLDGVVKSSILLPSGDLLISGEFGTTPTGVSPFIARYSGGRPAPSITQQPLSTTVCGTTTAQLTATVVPAQGLTSSWFWIDPISGAERTVGQGVNTDFAGTARFIATGVNTTALSLNPPGVPGSANENWPLRTRFLFRYRGSSECGTVVSPLAEVKAAGILCSPADIALNSGTPIPLGLPCNTVINNSGVNEGDYNAFFAADGFFYQAALGPAAVGMFCDIADDQGTAFPPFGTGGSGGASNSGVNEGDYNCFFNNLFIPCP